MQISGEEFTDYDDSAIEYEIYTDGCGGMTRLDNGCRSLGYWCEGCSRDINGLTIGDEYYLRVWFNEGREADICLQDVCDIAVTNHSVGTCDNGDNTYDLTVEISATGLEVGDSLVLNVNGTNSDNGLKITNSASTFTFTVSNLAANGASTYLDIFEWNGGCNSFFSDYYTAPSPCVSPPANDALSLIHI